MASVSDEMHVVLPGRLIAIEILLVLLLRQWPDAERIMREADAMLYAIEAELNERDDTSSTYARQVLTSARAALDKLSVEIIR